MADINNPTGAIILDPRDLPADHPADNETKQALYVRRGIESKINSSAPAASDDWVASQNPERMVAEVTKEIATKEARLAATTGTFDPATGEPVYAVTGRARESLQREVSQLTSTTLPYTKAQAAHIAKVQAALPTQADRLQAEGDRRERIGARALELAEEAEAQAQADRILTSRNRGGMA